MDNGATIELLFSKGTSLFSKLITWFTWGKYSHVDFVLQPGDVDNDKPLLLGSIAKVGVGFRPLESSLAKTKRSLFCEIECTKEQRDAVIQAALQEIGKPYDNKAIFGILAREDWEEDSKWFCSEYIAAMLSKGNIRVLRRKPSRVFPADLLSSYRVKPVKNHKYSL